MIKITRQDISHLAQLSSLNLSETEVDNLEVDLNKIIGYVNLLNELDTSQVEPTYQVTGLENVWRDDVIEQSTLTREKLLELAPDMADNAVKVPQVL